MSDKETWEKIRSLHVLAWRVVRVPMKVTWGPKVQYPVELVGTASALQMDQIRTFGFQIRDIIKDCPKVTLPHVRISWGTNLVVPPHPATTPPPTPVPTPPPPEPILIPPLPPTTPPVDEDFEWTV